MRPEDLRSSHPQRAYAAQAPRVPRSANHGLTLHDVCIDLYAIGHGLTPYQLYQQCFRQSPENGDGDRRSARAPSPAGKALRDNTRRLHGLRRSAQIAGAHRDVVGEYVKLRKSGPSRYMGLCPFHNEKTPSFTVHVVHQFYKCFSCGAGGDVVKFVMEKEASVSGRRSATGRTLRHSAAQALAVFRRRFAAARLRFRDARNGAGGFPRQPGERCG